MFARGELRFDQRRALMLPASAVMLREGFDVVLVVDAQSRVRQTKVTVLAREGDRVAVEGVDAQADVSKTKSSAAIVSRSARPPAPGIFGVSMLVLPSRA